ncbi:MAG: hypothetical protein K1X75_12950 [Leptospirales bacterium]|nr:hypothetical protein [Leptospirales bacterium]
MPYQLFSEDDRQAVLRREALYMRQAWAARILSALALAGSALWIVADNWPAAALTPLAMALALAAAARILRRQTQAIPDLLSFDFGEGQLRFRQGARRLDLGAAQVAGIGVQPLGRGRSAASLLLRDGSVIVLQRPGSLRRAEAFAACLDRCLQRMRRRSQSTPDLDESVVESRHGEGWRWQWRNTDAGSLLWLALFLAAMALAACGPLSELFSKSRLQDAGLMVWISTAVALILAVLATVSLFAAMRRWRRASTLQLEQGRLSLEGYSMERRSMRAMKLYLRLDQEPALILFREAGDLEGALALRGKHVLRLGGLSLLAALSLYFRLQRVLGLSASERD